MDTERSRVDGAPAGSGGASSEPSSGPPPRCRATGPTASLWRSSIAIIGLSLNIVLGYVGQVSLGHHAFVGIAAFVAAYYVSGSARLGRCTLLDSKLLVRRIPDGNRYRGTQRSVSRRCFSG